MCFTLYAAFPICLRSVPPSVRVEINMESWEMVDEKDHTATTTTDAVREMLWGLRAKLKPMAKVMRADSIESTTHHFKHTEGNAKPIVDVPVKKNKKVISGVRLYILIIHVCHSELLNMFFPLCLSLTGQEGLEQAACLEMA